MFPTSSTLNLGLAIQNTPGCHEVTQPPQEYHGHLWKVVR